MPNNVFTTIIFLFIFIVSIVSSYANIVLRQNNPLNFGNIQYSHKESFSLISRGLLSTRSTPISKANISPAVVEITGSPNEHILIEIPHSISLSNNVYISNISLKNTGSNITLDANGKATVEIIATLDVNDDNINGSFAATIPLKITSLKKKISSIQNVNVYANVEFVSKNTLMRTLHFGSIVYDHKGGCSVTINMGNSADHNNCVDVYNTTSLLYVFASPTSNITVTLPANFRIFNGTSNLTINDLKYVVKPYASGLYSLEVSGSIFIGRDTVSGAYTGQFNVEINY